MSLKELLLCCVAEPLVVRLSLLYMALSWISLVDSGQRRRVGISLSVVLVYLLLSWEIRGTKDKIVSAGNAMHT